MQGVHFYLSTSALNKNLRVLKSGRSTNLPHVLQAAFLINRPDCFDTDTGNAEIL